MTSEANIAASRMNLCRESSMVIGPRVSDAETGRAVRGADGLLATLSMRRPSQSRLRSKLNAISISTRGASGNIAHARLTIFERAVAELSQAQRRIKELEEEIGKSNPLSGY